MCEPTTIAMMVIAVATSVKASMDAKAQAKVQRQNAIARQKIEREQMLKQRAAQGDADALRAFEESRRARVEEARIRVATGEQGATTGNFQTDTLLQGLGFGTGLQNAAAQRSANNNLESSDLAIRASGVNFTNQMRTINASDPSGMDVLFSAAAAGAGAYAKAGGTFSGGGDPGGVPNQGTGGQVTRINVGR